MGEWPGRNIISPKIPLLVWVRHTFIHGNNIINKITTNNIDKFMIQTFLFMVSIEASSLWQWIIAGNSMSAWASRNRSWKLIENSGKLDVHTSIEMPWPGKWRESHCPSEHWDPDNGKRDNRNFIVHLMGPLGRSDYLCDLLLLK